MKLNYFPVQIEFDQFQINVEDYTVERLSELRKTHNATHSFFKNGDLIYISNKDGDDSIVLGKPADIGTYQNDGDVTSSLIKHVFFRTFKDRFPSRIPVDFYPFRFFSEQSKDDIIHNALPEKLRGKLGYKKLIELQLRFTRINGKPQFGFVINIRRNWIFSKTCAELAAEGFDMKGLDVLRAEVFPGSEAVLAPNEEFIGMVKEINGDIARVDTSEGLQTFPLSELFLRKTTFNLSSYLGFATSPEKRDEIIAIIANRKSEIYNTKKLYEEIVRIARSLFNYSDASGQQQPILFQNKDGFCFTVDTRPLEASNTIDLKAPAFIFDHAATKTESSYPDKGLNNYGPYDSLTFDIKSPNILCICHKDNRGFFAKFLADLRDGMPASSYFKKGFQKKYDLKTVSFDIKEVAYYDVSEYMKIIRENETKPDAAIIEIPAEWKSLEDSANPYYGIKAKLLGLEIPVQYVTYDRVRNYNEYILNSIALQLYAKLGGTPWVLPSSRSVDREIIIGIGHSWLRDKRYAGASSTRVVGITTFLSSDGQYLLSDKAKDVLYDEYFEELLRSLKNSIQRLESEQGWNEGDTIRLIFHIFKPIKNVEFDVIAKLVAEINKYKIQFAFITISKAHPFRLFDPSQPGVQKYGSTKGEFIPNRATNLFLDSATCVIQMLGARELKTDLHGMSTPIQIKIRMPQGNYENKTLDGLLFSDLSYIVQQIFSFTYLSWRSFLPGEQPATMFYSTLISNLLSRLRKVQGWDPDSLNYKLKRKKWFL